MTIFSAPNYGGEFDNAGALLNVDEQLICSFEILKPSPTNSKVPLKKVWCPVPSLGLVGRFTKSNLYLHSILPFSFDSLPKLEARRGETIDERSLTVSRMRRMHHFHSCCYRACIATLLMNDKRKRRVHCGRRKEGRYISWSKRC